MDRERSDDESSFISFLSPLADLMQKERSPGVIFSGLSGAIGVAGRTSVDCTARRKGRTLNA
jgi:hypothetical protein